MRAGVAPLWWAAVDGAPAWAARNRRSDELSAMALRRLSQVLRTAAGTPFWTQRLRDAGFAAGHPALETAPRAVLSELAPVGKAELRAAGASALRGGRVQRTWRWSHSSGSTGEPFRVYYDPRAWALLKWHVKLRARSACGVQPWDRLALLDAVAPGAPPDLLERAGRRARISVLQAPGAVAGALVSFAPTVVYGLPSALLEAARELGPAARDLRIRAVFTSGELLARPVRDELAAALGARVYDVYGTSETKEIAWECAEGGLHINADVVQLEALDDHGAPVPPGTEGDLVASLLVNHAMPLLRYRTGDRGALHPGHCRCGCSLPLMAVVTGRAADTLVFAGGHRVSPYALTCALETVDELLRYQVTQLDPGRLRVRAIASPAADRAAVIHRVQHALRERVAPYLQTDVEFVERLPTGPRAKFRVVQPLT